LRHTHGTFYYQRKDASEPGLPPGRPEALRETPPAPAAARDDITWRAPPKPDPIAARPLGGWDPAPALDLLRRERFADALACLRRAPPAAGRDPDILLLEAALLAHSGRFSAADIACRRLLMLDGLNAGAHYLLALCREHEDDRDGAGEHDRIASYLDPAFAMPWLHLGLLARRGGDPPTARQALGQALILLQREDASRILLFGGGFGRAALSALCETALRECGGRV
jgi:chemotaxis protein methyltransferase CheR